MKAALALTVLPSLRCGGGSGAPASGSGVPLRKLGTTGAVVSVAGVGADWL